MLTRPYGKTGKNISILSAGGMRYSDPDKIDEMAQIPLAAARMGVNYFDTAPGYSNDKSEIILGAAIRQIRKEGLEFYTATKTWGSDEKTVMQHFESSLKRFGTDHIDFYHAWGINDPKNFAERKKLGAIGALLKLKEQKLVSHVVCSSHMEGDDISRLCDEGVFEGILVGFCAINFPFRMAGLRGAARNSMGVVTMNPLGGGMIMDHEDRFSFIKARPGMSMLEAALHFNLAHPEITSVLVGFRNIEDVRTAVAAAESFKPVPGAEIDRIKKHIETNFNELCTTCNYCNECPQGIPVVRFMESYNHYMLYGKPEQIFDRLKWHWGIQDLSRLEDCTECGLCEKVCNQKLPIMKRYAEMRTMKK